MALVRSVVADGSQAVPGWEWGPAEKPFLIASLYEFGRHTSHGERVIKLCERSIIWLRCDKHFFLDALARW